MNPIKLNELKRLVMRAKQGEVVQVVAEDLLEVLEEIEGFPNLLQDAREDGWSSCTCRLYDP